MTGFGRILRMLRRGRTERELDAEVRAYADQLAAEKMAAGMSAEEARRAAAIELGGAEQVKEAVREARAGFYVEQFVQDFRYAVRGLRRAPGFAAVAILTLALGIGVSTAIFSVVDTVLFRPLPYFEPERLVMVYEGELGNGVLAPTELNAYRKHAKTLVAVAGLQPMSVTLLGGEQPKQVTGALVSAPLFPMLRVQPLLGRLFLEDEDRPGAGQVALLSEDLWRRRFGADPAIVGKSANLEVNEMWGPPPNRSQAFVIVGVLPASFRTHLRGADGDVWFPLATSENDNHALFVIGRMSPGVSPAQVKQELESVTAPLRDTVHSDKREMRVRVLPLLDDLLGDWRRALLVLSGAVLFVVLIACANLANLLELRGQSRRREMALRAALGAGRARLVRQTLAESAVLAVFGGVLGLLVALWCVPLLAGAAPADIARMNDVKLDWRVLLFAAGLTASATAGAGLTSAVRPSGRATQDDLKDGARSVGTRGTGKGRAVLVVTQVALAVVLLIGSGLMIQTLAGFARVETGFDPNDVLTMRFSLPRQRYATPPQRPSFFEPLLERIRALPGVESVAVDHAMPFGGVSTGTQVGRLPDKLDLIATWRMISANYFATLKIPVLRGRVFTTADLRGGRFVIINQSLAARLWSTADPVGQPLHLASGPPYTVVGVVGNTRTSALTGESGPQIYFSVYPRAGGLLIRSTAETAVLLPAVRKAFADLEPSLAPSDVRLMEERVVGIFSVQRYTALLLSLFSVAALFLGAIGLYGVVSFSVSRRTNEIGVRLALGATRSAVMSMVLRQGMALVFVGAALGLAAAFALTRFLAGLLFGVTARDPATFGAVAAALLAVGFAACLIPALRAARVDPLVALRHE